MTHGLWHSVAGLQAQQLRQDHIANNLANIETAGFKPDYVAFRERLAASLEGGAPGNDNVPAHDVFDRLSGGLAADRPYTSFLPGAMIPTTNPLDLAVEGDGFFSVRTREGVRYTRDGQFTTNKDGQLVTAAGGYPVLDVNGRTMEVDGSSREPITVDETGTLRQGATAVGQLAVTRFADRADLKKAGQNLYDATGARRLATTGRVRSNAYESSAVSPITELVRMIEAGRAYGVNAQLIQIQDETLGRAVNDVGRVAGG